jgi:hypothetical protein
MVGSSRLFENKMLIENINFTQATYIQKAHVFALG